MMNVIKPRRFGDCLRVTGQLTAAETGCRKG